MAEIFRGPLKLPTDMHFVYDIKTNTLCRRGGTWVVSQKLNT